MTNNKLDSNSTAETLFVCASLTAIMCKVMFYLMCGLQTGKVVLCRKVCDRRNHLNFKGPYILFGIARGKNGRFVVILFWHIIY